MGVRLDEYMKPKSTIYIVIGVLFTAGILVISFTEVFSENWFIGLGLIGISLAIIIITVISKMKQNR